MRLPAIRLSIRARTTLVATIVVGVALAVASGALIVSTRSGLRNSIRDSAKARATEIAQLAQETTLSASISSAGEALLVQVLDSKSRVIASSPSIEGQGPLVDVTLAPGESLSRDVATVAEVDGQGGDPAESPTASGWTLAAEGVQAADGPVTVVVVAPLGAVDEISGILLPIVYQGGPILLVVVAGLTWILTGAALRPVEAIRQDAAGISAADLGRRLPVPAAHDEIRDLAETMNLMLDRIEAATIVQRRFTADASHELKSPVAAIRTMVEVARRDPRYDNAAELLDDVLAEDTRLELLVSDLLVLVRYDEEGLTLHVAPTDLGVLATEEADALRARTDLQATVETEGGLRGAVDQERIRQLLRNLLDNAARYARSEIWVSVRHEGTGFVLDVSDDGPGIAPEDRERVFERFVRLDTGRARTQGGTGLGLAVCRAIARAHGGEVRVVTPTHAGTTVELRLPAKTPS
jgi:signal transduction histidine kinase